MGEFKGTPGPWSVIEHSWSDSSIVNVHGETVASLSIYEEATEETQDALEDQMGANFKLIASAPELLAMVVDHRKRISEIRDIMEGQHSMWSHHRQMFNDLLNESEELIAKALGDK